MQWAREWFSNRDRLELLASLESRAQKTTVFRTVTGHLGVTRGSVKSGDVVALVAGHERPLILRSDEENWRYVAASVVRGIMNGEERPQNANTDDMETFVLV